MKSKEQFMQKTIVVYPLWEILLNYNSVSKVTVFGFMNPVFGVILSALLLGETDSLGMMCVVALLLVRVGTCIVNRPDTTEKCNGVMK